MQFSRERPARHAINRYQRESLWIDGVAHQGSLALSSEAGLLDWQCPDIGSLTEALLAPLLSRQPEVLVLATGDAVRFPDAALLRTIQHQGIGVEVMNDGAAVRTYNVMLSEDRHVILALLR